MNLSVIFALLAAVCSLVPLVSSQSDNSTASLTEDQKHKIREEVYREQLVKQAKDDQKRRERETQQDMERQRQFMQQNTRPAFATPTSPITAVQPVGASGTIAGIPVSNPQQRTIDPMQLLTSGMLSSILSPKLMSPEEASGQLTPQLVGPQLQQQQARSMQQMQSLQQPQADARQFMPGMQTNPYGMQPTGYQQSAIPAFGQAVPTFGQMGGYPQQMGAGSMMQPTFQQFPGQTGFANPAMTQPMNAMG